MHAFYVNISATFLCSRHVYIYIDSDIVLVSEFIYKSTLAYKTRALPTTMAPSMATAPTTTPLDKAEAVPADRELVAAAALEEAALPLPLVEAGALDAAETPVADSEISKVLAGSRGRQHSREAKAGQAETMAFPALLCAMVALAETAAL